MKTGSGGLYDQPATAFGIEELAHSLDKVEKATWLVASTKAHS
jgi:hypothetical protein